MGKISVPGVSFWQEACIFPESSTYWPPLNILLFRITSHGHPSWKANSALYDLLERQAKRKEVSEE